MKRIEKDKTEKRFPVIAWFVFVGILILAVAAVIFLFRPQAWYESDCLVEHALGGYEADSYTNSLEAFRYNAEQGRRIFEVDFLETEDGHLVLGHTWEDTGLTLADGEAPDLDTFLSGKIQGKYTPMSWVMLLQEMKKYPQISIVTDCKVAKGPNVAYYAKRLSEEAIEAGYEDELNRVVIQFYYEDDLAAIKAAYPFKHYIFTLYSRGFEGDEQDFEGICQFCKENGVECITMWADRWSVDLKPIKEKYDRIIAVHTVNDNEEARMYLDSGVELIYTDFATTDGMGIRLGPIRTAKIRLKKLIRKGKRLWAK